MAISYVGQNAVIANTMTLPTHQKGDLLVMFAARDGSTTAPTVPSINGWISAGVNTGTNCAAVVAFKIANSDAEECGTWDNASGLACHVYRGCLLSGDAIIRKAGTNGTGTTVNYSGIVSMTDAGNSWGLRFAFHSQANTNLQTAPNNFTNKSNAVSGIEIAGHDTNGAVSSVSFGSVNVGGTSGNWVSQTIEILQAATEDITYVDSTSADGSSSSPSVAKPSGLQNGDVVIVVIHSNGPRNASDNNGAAPFTSALANREYNGPSAQVDIFYRVINGSEGSTFDFTLDGSDRWAIIATAYRGVDTSTIFDVAPSASTENAVTGLTQAIIRITTGTDGSRVISFGANDSSTNTMTNFPAGFTLRENESGQQLLALADLNKATAGQIAAGNWQNSISNGVSYNNTFALLKSSGAAPTNVDDSRAAKITGKDTANANRAAKIIGNAATTANRAAKIVGNAIATAARNAKITGFLTTTANRAAKIIGSAAETANRAAKIIGVDSASSNRVAKITGYLTTSVNRAAKIIGSALANANRAAKVTGSDTATTNRAAKVTGKDDATANRAAKIIGIASSTANRAAKIVGNALGTAARNAKIIGSDVASAIRNAKVTGITGANDSRAAKIAGVDTTTANRLARIIGYLTASAARGAKVIGNAVASAGRAAKIIGEGSVTAIRNAKIAGNAQDSANRSAKTTGSDVANTNRLAKIIGYLTANANRLAKLTGNAVIIGSRNATINGINRKSENRAARIIGSITLVVTRAAKLSGIDTIAANVSAKIVGSSTASASRGAKIIGKGDWNTQSPDNWYERNEQEFVSTIADDWHTRLE